MVLQVKALSARTQLQGPSHPHHAPPARPFSCGKSARPARLTLKPIRSLQTTAPAPGTKPPTSTPPPATQHTPPQPAAAPLTPPAPSTKASSTQRPVFRYPEDDPSIVALDVASTVLGIILGGGEGRQLYPLTNSRAKPAIPMAANYRLIDITVSNCLNSGLEQVYVLTQHNAASLNRHLQQVYQQTSASRLHHEGFVEALPAAPSSITSRWAQGSADAVRLHMWAFEEAIKEGGVQDLLVLSGDHLYRMDYRAMLRAHRESGADITIAALPADAPSAPDLGLMKVDMGDGWRVTEFVEKPGRESLVTMSTDTAELFGLPKADAHKRPYIASMGVYAIKAAALKKLLMDTCKNSNDFGKEVIPAAQIAGYKLVAFPFTGYWKNVNSIRQYYDANMALADSSDATLKFDLFDERAPLLTALPMHLPPTRMGDAELVDVVVGEGTTVRRGSTIRRSVLGVRSVVGRDVVMEDTVLLGADYYETARDLAGEAVAMGVGDGCRIRKAIIDKNARIGRGSVILNKEGLVEGGSEKLGWVVVDGVVVVFKGATLGPGTVI